MGTHQALAKVGWILLPQPAHSPDLAPSDYHLFGTVKHALRGRHFADDNQLKETFRHVIRNRIWECYNIGIQRLTQRWQKCVES
jgi:histone-lysine N-methyltransferase SETMAR